MQSRCFCRKEPDPCYHANAWVANWIRFWPNEDKKRGSQSLQLSEALIWFILDWMNVDAVFSQMLVINKCWLSSYCVTKYFHSSPFIKHWWNLVFPSFLKIILENRLHTNSIQHNYYETFQNLMLMLQFQNIAQQHNISLAYILQKIIP